MTSKAVIPGFHSATTQVGTVRLHHWLGGPPDGRPVLLWHGFLSTAYAWRHVAASLAANGMAVLVPDMRGYGDSDKPEGVAGYDARSLAEDFRALVAATGFGAGRPLLLAAHDMGAPPALLWAADHPDEVAGLLYADAPVMLGDQLRRILSYDRASMARGSLWWWLLPLAPGVPERLVVGNERAFLTWFHEGATARPDVFDRAAVDEVLRTFAGRQGVLGAMGVYRAAFDSIDQTEAMLDEKVGVPVVALGGAKGLGDAVGQTLRLVATNVEAETIPDCGHFVPEERPDALIHHILALAARTA